MRTIFLAPVLLIAGLLGVGDAAEQSIGKPETALTAAPDAGARAAILSEYRARRAKMPDTAYAHHELALWCQQNGLETEAVVHFRLRVEAQKKEARAQKQWVHDWEPRLRKWKSWLATKGFRGEAETALNGVTDPRAVPAIWKVFATSKAPPDQRRAVQLLGQIECAASSRGLALLAVSGESAEVRRAAAETLRWRDPMEFAGVLIGLLRDPVKYEVRPVRGPGLPGSVTVKGTSIDLEHVYAPPPPPNIPIYPDDVMRFDAGGSPILSRHTDTVDLPFVWVGRGGFTYPSYGITPPGLPITSHIITPPHVPVEIHLGAMWRENWKSAQSAQRQLGGQVAALEQLKAMQRAANEQIVQVLNQAIGERLPADRAACYSWWYRKHGRTYTPPRERPRPTLTEFVPLDYLPREVGGLGYDPINGYYVRASTFGW
jgi:hypothetical protein